MQNSCHGCYVNGECFNHVVYADDTLLLAPSPTALQNLIDICCHYFTSQRLVINYKKCKCVAVCPKSLRDLCIPKLFVNGSVLRNVEQEMYLSFIMTSRNDESDTISDTITNDVSEALAIALLANHGLTHQRTHRNVSAPTARGPKLERPKVNISVSTEEWNVFTHRWEMFGSGSAIDEALAPAQLFQCTGDELSDSLLKANRQAASNILSQLLVDMRSFAVIQARSQTFGGGSNLSNFGTFYDYVWIILRLLWIWPFFGGGGFR